ncbi:hypothetical protein LCGC14_1903970 [marine sediment metagenome]|uniref:ABC-2 type transporter domain-containing protein n=1 Tax=marine sediment metagenome TaxID=412755 RepID=A0A0F9FVP4_9ZZZZ
MKRESKTKSSLFYEKHLFLFYMKKSILSIKFIVCFILILIPIFQILSELEYTTIFNQRDLDKNMFWQRFIGSYSQMALILISVIIAADIVSGEFSNKSAMIIYATESRYKILTIKLLCLIISIFILMLFYFSAFLIMIFIKTDLLISIPIFLTAFLIIFVELIFYSSLTFMVSAITRSINLSYILPFFYILINPFLDYYELGLLSFNSYKLRVFDFFTNLFFSKIIELNAVTIFCFIFFFGVSLLIILLTFYIFNQIDIRVD